MLLPSGNAGAIVRIPIPASSLCAVVLSTSSDCQSLSPAPFVKSPLSSFRPEPSNIRTPRSAKPFQLINGPQHRETLFRRYLGSFHHTVEHLPVIHLHHIAAARDPQLLHRIRD